MKKHKPSDPGKPSYAGSKKSDPRFAKSQFADKWIKPAVFPLALLMTFVFAFAAIVLAMFSSIAEFFDF